jgi:molybdopterin molybdotransferase
MTTPLDVLAWIDQLPLLPPRLTPLSGCASRQLAAPTHAAASYPRCDQSAMDGYALRLDAPPDAPRLVVGIARPGHPYPGQLAPHEAVRIYTGAHMPHGAHAVARQERAHRAGDMLTIEGSLNEWADVRRAGEEVRQEALLWEAGELLDGRHLALARAAGLEALEVRPAPRVALIISGDEVDDLGDLNGLLLTSALQALGAEVTLERCADDLSASIAALERASSAALIVTTGGMSVGDHDAMWRAVAACGRWELRGVAQRPGRPLGVGAVGQSPLIGLPGTPAAVLVAAHTYVREAALRLMGAPRAAQRAVDDLSTHARDVWAWLPCERSARGLTPYERSGLLEWSRAGWIALIPPRSEASSASAGPWCWPTR